MFFAPYKKYKNLLHLLYRRYKQKKASLTPDEEEHIVTTLKKLEECINKQDIRNCREYAFEARLFAKQHLRRSFFQWAWDNVVSLTLAILLAIVIRPMVFELYMVPTGSMRPTILEEDRLYVSKSTFGLNVPTQPYQFYFDPELVTRGSCAVMTSENMEVKNADVWNFYIIPGKKQLVKRLIGKPGDRLYFYGGKLYGIDINKKDITHELQQKVFSYVTHIPYITQEGRVQTPHTPKDQIYSPVVLSQFNQKVAELSAINQYIVDGKTLPQNGRGFKELYEMWGIGNYAQCRIISKSQYASFTGDTADSNAAVYLQLRHHPTTQNAFLAVDPRGKVRPHLGAYESYLPLSDTHLHTIYKHLTTMRFTAKDGYLYMYSYETLPGNPKLYSPKMAGIPNGTYEFFDGKAYQIGFGGTRSELAKTHPLLQYTKEKAITFFNHGIEFITYYAPIDEKQTFFPSRYAYYNSGDLYLMGQPIAKKTDPYLTSFVEREKAKQQVSTKKRPYPPFIDTGAPVHADGSINTALIEEQGLIVPENHYCLLGDNAPGSADSRDFGFVPAQNLRGAPIFTFFPFTSFGFINQSHYPWLTIPHSIVWTLVFIGIIIWRVAEARKRNTKITWE